MEDWFEKACEELDQQFEAGEISKTQYLEHMRGLRADLRQIAEDKAQEAYDSVMGVYF